MAQFMPSFGWAYVDSLKQGHKMSNFRSVKYQFGGKTAPVAKFPAKVNQRYFDQPKPAPVVDVEITAEMRAKYEVTKWK